MIDPLKVLVVCPELPRPGNLNTLAPLERQIESLRGIGLDVTVLEIRGIKRLKYLQQLPRFWKMVANCDIVHAHYTFCGWFAKTQFKRPVVLSLMGTDLMGVTNEDGSVTWRSRFVMRMTKAFAHAPEALIVKSDDMASHLPSMSPFVTPNGVDMVNFRPIPRAEARRFLGWSENGLRVLFPGHPANRRKGFTLAEKAIACASQQLAVPIETVILKGMSPEQVPWLMNACDAMILTSHHEGSPNVVKEAMACDLAAVSVDVGDVRRLIDNLPGYAIGTRSGADLGAKLANMLHCRPRPRGRVRLQELGLDLESVARRVAKIYEHALQAWHDDHTIAPLLSVRHALAEKSPAARPPASRRRDAAFIGDESPQAKEHHETNVVGFERSG